MINALTRIPVGVVVERRKAASPWIDFTWKPVAVLAGEPEASPWTRLSEDADAVTFYAGAAQIELLAHDFVDDERQRFMRKGADLNDNATPFGRGDAAFQRIEISRDLIGNIELRCREDLCVPVRTQRDVSADPLRLFERPVEDIGHRDFFRTCQPRRTLVPGNVSCDMILPSGICGL